MASSYGWVLIKMSPSAEVMQLCRCKSSELLWLKLVSLMMYNLFMAGIIIMSIFHNNDEKEVACCHTGVKQYIQVSFYSRIGYVPDEDLFHFCNKLCLHHS